MMVLRGGSRALGWSAGDMRRWFSSDYIGGARFANRNLRQPLRVAVETQGAIVASSRSLMSPSADDDAIWSSRRMELESQARATASQARRFCIASGRATVLVSPGASDTR